MEEGEEDSDTNEEEFEEDSDTEPPTKKRARH
jgi:hypothetical protein